MVIRLRVDESGEAEDLASYLRRVALDARADDGVVVVQARGRTDERMARAFARSWATLHERTVRDE